MNIHSTKSVVVALVLTAMSCMHGVAGAQSDQGRTGMSGRNAAAADMTAGEVQKVDRAAGRLTLKHGPIRNMDMPAMTMVFGVRDKAMLDKVKAGDRVRFMVASEDGRMLVTDIQPAR